jgi:membrane protein required for colicin V production
MLFEHIEWRPVVERAVVSVTSTPRFGDKVLVEVGSGAIGRAEDARRGEGLFMTGSPTALDAALLAVAIISGLLAMYRGFSRELLSIASWIAAAAAAAYFVVYQKPLAENLATQMGMPLQVAQIGAGGLIFLIVLIVVHLITSRISDMVLDSRVGMIDRILGFLFGVARAFVLVLIPYMGLAAAVEKKDQHPEWVRNSWSMQMIEPASESLSVFLKQRALSIYSKKAPEKT